MTPQGLVKVMNRYLSIMSQPIRNHRGIIDKYMGDAIMAYWGPPFTEDTEHARLACLAALDMVACVEPLQAELPELLGVRRRFTAALEAVPDGGPSATFVKRIDWDGAWRLDQK
jgi:class 3 adenylate cyclase